MDPKAPNSAARMAQFLFCSGIYQCPLTDILVHAYLQFIYVDPAWECMMGYRAVDVMGKATHDFFTCTTCALIEAISLNIKDVCVL